MATSKFVLCAWAAIAGIFIGTFFSVPKNDYASYDGQKFTFQGLVVEDPVVKNKMVSLVVQPAAGAIGTMREKIRRDGLCQPAVCVQQ